MTFRRAMAPAGAGAGLLLAAGGLAWGTAAPWRAAHAATAGFEEHVVLAAAGLAWAALGYVVLVLAVTALAALPGATGTAFVTVSHRITPAATRRAARAALGLSVAAGSLAGTVPATAAGGSGPGQAGSTVAAGAAALPGVGRPGLPLAAADLAAGPLEASPQALPAIGRPDGAPGGWTPDVPAATADPVAAEPTPEVRLVAAAPRDDEAVLDEVVVRRGDSLWTVAARALGPDAGAAEIAAEWPRWWEANRDVVGEDPDLVLPGTVLRAPAER